MSKQAYFVYITTNPSKSTLYIGVTNDIAKRLDIHFQNRGDKSSFAGKYHCYNLVYFEAYESVEDAIKREKEIKKWRREKKNKLIESQNSKWDFLNNNFY